jgi:general secretion pathway protein G
MIRRLCQSRSSREGFTLIELMIVLALISILATMGMTQYRASIVHAKEAVLRDDLLHLRDAIDQYYADKGQYPATLDALVTDGYLRKIP